MIVFGGFDGQNRYNDLQELHLHEKRWTQITVRSSVPRSRFGHTSAMYGHSMFVFGGWDGHDTIHELFEYNVSSNMWIHLPLRGTPPRARYRHTAVVCGDAMFTFGGVDKTQYRFPDLHEYNFTHRHWSKVSCTSVQLTLDQCRCVKLYSCKSGNRYWVLSTPPNVNIASPQTTAVC